MSTLLAILTVFANTFWQGAVLAGLVWVALRLFSVNAATRSVIWWVVLLTLIALPVVPGLRVRPRAEIVAFAPSSSTVLTSRVSDVLPTQSAILTLPEKKVERWPLVIFGFWIAAAVYKLARIIQSYLYLRRVKQGAAHLQVVTPDIGRRAILLVSDEIASPMAVGFLKPAVIVPRDLMENIVREEMDQVLLHEAAHLARWDDWTNLLGRLLGALLAIHPIAWWVLRQVEHEREVACDDWVVARTGEARAYAAVLAHMVELQWQARPYLAGEVLASGVFGHGSRIGDRIEMLLRRGREFSARVSLGLVALCTLGLCCLAAAGSLAPRWIALAKTPPVHRAAAAMPVAIPTHAEPARLIAQAVPSPPPIPAPATPRLTFEVAAIRPSPPPAGSVMRAGPRGGPGTNDPERFTTENFSLANMLSMAFATRDYPISGPGWMDDLNFNIEAKVAAGATREDLRAMLRNLLIDRFGLKFHYDRKETAVYRLVTVKSGPKFETPTKVVDASGDVPPAGGPFRMGDDGCPVIPEGSRVTKTGARGRVRERWREKSMQEIAESLAGDAGRPVQDATGLAGKYNFSVCWSTEGMTGAPAYGARESAGGGQAIEPSGMPGLFEALQQQMGLKLEPAMSSAEVLVVDHLEKVPTEN